jgi:hypothetical protein
MSWGGGFVLLLLYCKLLNRRLSRKPVFLADENSVFKESLNTIQTLAPFDGL